MKLFPVFILLVAGLLVGCEYTAALKKKADVKIDSSLVGLWKKTNGNDSPTQLLVLPWSEYEYVVAYGLEDGIVGRGCLVRVGDRTLVQVKWLGTVDGDLPETDRVYQYIDYSLEDGKLTFRRLNDEVVDPDTATGKGLARLIKKHKDHPELFVHEETFVRSGDSK